MTRLAALAWFASRSTAIDHPAPAMVEDMIRLRWLERDFDGGTSLSREAREQLIAAAATTCQGYSDEEATEIRRAGQILKGQGSE